MTTPGGPALEMGVWLQDSPPPSPPPPRRPGTHPHSPLLSLTASRDRSAPPAISAPLPLSSGLGTWGRVSILAVTPARLHRGQSRPGLSAAGASRRPRRRGLPAWAGSRAAAARPSTGLPVSARMPPVTGGSLSPRAARSGLAHRAASPSPPRFLHLPPRLRRNPLAPSALGSLRAASSFLEHPRASPPVYGVARLGFPGPAQSRPSTPVPGRVCPARPHPGRGPLPCCSAKSPGEGAGLPSRVQLLGSYLLSGFRALSVFYGPSASC